MVCPMRFVLAAASVVLATFFFMRSMSQPGLERVLAEEGSQFEGERLEKEIKQLEKKCRRQSMHDHASLVLSMFTGRYLYDAARSDFAAAKAA